MKRALCFLHHTLSEAGPCLCFLIRAFKSTDHIKNNSLVPPGFDPMEDDVPLAQEAEVMQDTQRSEISPCEYEKAKKSEERRGVKMLQDSKLERSTLLGGYRGRVVGIYVGSYNYKLRI
ncbi:uncharacterized protein LOC132050316 [Lycium ferocissimum]|uniref:uncharacterized protein LOC132050316 n=1 Tax=Lycium ferocissimum TaxID=112874 RepID=UPI0028152281|nr:uncharacterized protein LOC132050316 [Lycium ferocissimum]